MTVVCWRRSKKSAKKRVQQAFWSFCEFERRESSAEFAWGCGAIKAPGMAQCNPRKWRRAARIVWLWCSHPDKGGFGCGATFSWRPAKFNTTISDTSLLFPETVGFVIVNSAVERWRYWFLFYYYYLIMHWECFCWSFFVPFSETHFDGTLEDVSFCACVFSHLFKQNTLIIGCRLLCLSFVLF